MKQDKVLVACPKCGHTQHEPAAAYSSVCKKCRQYFRLEEVLRAAAQAGKETAAPARDIKHVTCFQCGTDLEVSPSAQSTMCKRCSSHLDLRDYVITNAVSKNFRTRGKFVIEEGGFVFNTETFVADAVIKGRFLGKLNAQHSLEIHRTAEIKGSFTTGNLIIPPGSVFRWAEPIKIGDADIAGELIADVKAEGKVVLRSSARLFGNIQAGALEVEPGAIVVGSMRVGLTPEPEPTSVLVQVPLIPAPSPTIPQTAPSKPEAPRASAARATERRTATKPRVARDSSS
jgi:cytoskeletal protein CcmA (bactofilin family)/DNA-directed RNA polymerase subunit RPC12/RpoP